jgi:hypothetical protein
MELYCVQLMNLGDVRRYYLIAGSRQTITSPSEQVFIPQRPVKALFLAASAA